MDCIRFARIPRIAALLARTVAVAILLAPASTVVLAQIETGPTPPGRFLSENGVDTTDVGAVYEALDSERMALSRKAALFLALSGTADAADDIEARYSRADVATRPIAYLRALALLGYPGTQALAQSYADSMYARVSQEGFTIAHMHYADAAHLLVIYEYASTLSRIETLFGTTPDFQGFEAAFFDVLRDIAETHPQADSPVVDLLLSLLANHPSEQVRKTAVGELSAWVPEDPGGEVVGTLRSSATSDSSFDVRTAALDALVVHFADENALDLAYEALSSANSEEDASELVWVIMSGRSPRAAWLLERAVTDPSLPYAEANRGYLFTYRPPWPELTISIDESVAALHDDLTDGLTYELVGPAGFVGKLQGRLGMTLDFLAASDSVAAASSLLAVARALQAAASSPDGDGFATQAGLGYFGGTAQQLLDRLPALPTLSGVPAALSVSAPTAAATFNGNPLLISGYAHTLAGEPDPAESVVHAVLATTPEARTGLREALNPADYDSVVGAGGEGDITLGTLGFDPPAIASYFRGLTTDTLATSFTGSIGSSQDPVVAYAPNGLRLSGTLEGFGVLIVDGTLLERGGVEWVGLVIVRSSGAEPPSFEMSGNVSVIGGVLLYGEAGAPASVSMSGRSEIRYSPATLDRIRTVFFLDS